MKNTKLYLLLPFILLFPVLLSAQSDKDKVKKGRQEFLTKKGKLRMETGIKDGKLHGKHYEYFPGPGTLAIQGKYKRGYPKGKWKHYYRNGNKKAAGKYIAAGNGEIVWKKGIPRTDLKEKTGTWKYYRRNGNLKEKTAHGTDANE